MKKLRIDVWSDIACPWCYVGKRHLEAALARFPHRDAVEVVWRAFELDPSAPREREHTTSYADRLAKKYGTSAREAQTRIDGMTDIARADGLVFDFEKIRPGNTFDAHRLLHLAHERGVQDAVKERFLLGYMSRASQLAVPKRCFVWPSKQDSMPTPSAPHSRPTTTLARSAKTRPRRTKSESRAFRSSSLVAVTRFRARSQRSSFSRHFTALGTSYLPPPSGWKREPFAVPMGATESPHAPTVQFASSIRL